jgi:hypothetical protein
MKGNPQEPIRRPDPDPSSICPLQDTQLVAQCQDLTLQRASGLNRRQQRDEQRSQDDVHGSGR